MNFRRQAYTFLEILIVITMTAILTIAMASSLRSNRNSADFKEFQLSLVGMVQEARGLSLSNQLVGEDGSETGIDYYQLDFQPSFAKLKAVDKVNGSPNIIKDISEYTYPEAFTVNIDAVTANRRVFFFPPFGEICLNSDCNDIFTEKRFYLDPIDPEFGKQAVLKIDVFGGFPELEEFDL